MAIRGGVDARPNRFATPVGAIVVALFFLFPYLLMVLSSLKTREEITKIPPAYLPATPQFKNYLSVWGSAVAPGSSLLATIVISVGATLLVLVIATPASYYIARFRFSGRMVFLFLVLVTQMLQPTVLAVGLYQEFSQWKGHLVWLALILINGAFNLSFAVWIMQAFFASIPQAIDEAARLDGLGHLQTMFRVSLPLVWPGIVTAIVFVFVNTWNEFAAAFVLVQDNTLQPLTVSMPRFLGMYIRDWQYMFTVATIAIIPVVVLFGLIEKRLIGGLTAGAVK
jgi:multiple sugar transport system permease protein